MSLLETPALDLTIPRSVPPGGVVARLRGSERAHALVPAPVALAGVDIATRLATGRSPGRRAALRARMDAVVGGTEREGDLDLLTTRYAGAAARDWELMWRPRQLLEMPIEGLHRLAAIEPGRGILFSTVHLGPLAGLAALPHTLGVVDCAVGDQLWSESLPAGYHGYQIEQCRRMMARAGYRAVRAAGSAATFLRTLQAGGRVQIHFDVPGRSPVQFLGKTVEVMSGTARLAVKTDAVIVPAVALPRGRGWAVHLDAPLDPRGFEGWEALLQATADVHSRLVLRAPEHLENPLRESGWAVATRTGWQARR